MVHADPTRDRHAETRAATSRRLNCAWLNCFCPDITWCGGSLDYEAAWEIASRDVASVGRKGPDLDDANE